MFLNRFNSLPPLICGGGDELYRMALLVLWI